MIFKVIEMLRILICFLYICLNLSQARKENVTTCSKVSVLVVLYGQLRGGPISWNSMERYLLDYYSADLALLGPQDTNADTLRIRIRAKYIWEVKEYDDWGDVFSIISKGNQSWRNLCEISKQAQFLGGAANCHPGSAGILLAYRYFARRHLNIMSVQDQYKWVIFTRSDYDYLCSPPCLSTLNSNSLYVPSGESYGGYTDRFTILPASMANDSFAITEDLIMNWEWWQNRLLDRYNGSVNLEILIKEYVLKMSLPITLFPHVAFTIRRSRDPTRWATGSVTNKTRVYGLNVKYKMELNEALKTCDPWFQHEVNNKQYEIESDLSS